jgi:hypothetical protein
MEPPHFANKEIGRVLFANYRKMHLSGAAKQLNEGRNRALFRRLERRLPGDWRSEVNSNCRYRFVNSQTWRRAS